MQKEVETMIPLDYNLQGKRFHFGNGKLDSLPFVSVDLGGVWNQEKKAPNVAVFFPGTGTPSFRDKKEPFLLHAYYDKVIALLRDKGFTGKAVFLEKWPGYGKKGSEEIRSSLRLFEAKDTFDLKGRIITESARKIKEHAGDHGRLIFVGHSTAGGVLCHYADRILEALGRENEERSFLLADSPSAVGADGIITLLYEGIACFGGAALMTTLVNNLFPETWRDRLAMTGYGIPKDVYDNDLFCRESAGHVNPWTLNRELLDEGRARRAWHNEAVLPGQLYGLIGETDPTLKKMNLPIPEDKVRRMPAGHFGAREPEKWLGAAGDIFGLQPNIDSR